MKKVKWMGFIILIVGIITLLPVLLKDDSLVTTTASFQGGHGKWHVDYQYDYERDQEDHVGYFLLSHDGGKRIDLSKVKLVFKSNGSTGKFEDLSKSAYTILINEEGECSYKILVGSVFPETKKNDQLLMDIIEKNGNNEEVTRLVLSYKGPLSDE